MHSLNLRYRRPSEAELIPACSEALATAANVGDPEPDADAHQTNETSNPPEVNVSEV